MTLAASFVATLVNPHGPALLGYAFKVSTSSQLGATIAEWQSPNFHSYLYVGMIIGPILLLLGLLAFSETVFSLDDVALACMMFLAALHAVRFTPYFVLAACAARAVETAAHRNHPPECAFAAHSRSAGRGAVSWPARPGRGHRGAVARAPVAATNFLEHQSGRVFTTYWWGDYLIYRHIPVFVDGRTDLYFGTDILQTYSECRT